jgi:hypothetical protein
LARFVWTGVVLQLVMVAVGHVNETVLALSGVLGTGIPFVLGVAYGLTTQAGFGQASRGGLSIGAVGAVAGVLVAILLGDANWMLLTFAPIASALMGGLGALVGRVGRRPAADA